MFRLLCAVIVVVSGCSDVPPEDSSRLLGGADADIEDTPYMASIERIGYRHECGAVIISSQWILTNSLCQYLPDVTDFQVRVGSAISNDGSGSAGGVLHNVIEWREHPYSDATNREYDFALAKVNPPFAFNDNVTTAALPALDLDTPEGAAAVVSGWGQAGDFFGPVTQLQSANMMLLSDSECNTTLAGGYNLRTLCAKGSDDGVALCWHDQGSPLVSDGTVYGIAIWSQLCTDPDDVQLFARVASVRDWIDFAIGTSS